MRSNSRTISRWRREIRMSYKLIQAKLSNMWSLMTRNLWMESPKGWIENYGHLIFGICAIYSLFLTLIHNCQQIQLEANNIHMLNNKNPQQKQKNDLVFKLLKSMNPYMPDISENSAIRDQLYSIIQAEGNHIIQESEEGDSVGEEEIERCERNIVRMIVSRVVDVQVDNGRLGGEVRREMEGVLMRQLEAERQSKIVRKQLEDIQSSAYKQFRIPKQVTKYSHASSSAFASSRPISSFVQKIPTTNTFYTDPIKNSQFSHFNPSIMNSRRQFYSEVSPNLDQISEKFSGLRLELSKLQSPVKSYRYETDRLKSANSSNKLNQKNELNYDSKSQLPLQSRIKHTPKLQKSQSQLTIKQKNPSTIINYNSLTKSSKILPSPTSSYRSKPLQLKMINKAKTLLTDSRKFSEKLQKQSRKLDVEIIASILHSKIRDRDKSNTIAHLIK